MNAYANHMVSYLLAQSWQIALLAAMVGLISFALRNRSAHLRYLLWLIVPVKCLVPPVLTVPLAVLPERSLSPSIAAVAPPEEHSAPETPVLVGGDPKPQESTLAVPSARELIALAWTAGVFLFLLWVGGRAIRYNAWLHDRRRPLPPGLQESIRELSEGFKFRKGPRIWLLEDISQPFVWGVLRGSVYLPADFVGLSGSDRQRNTLAHELSHIARFDAGVNLLQVLGQAVYWFHPFVWWANRKIRQEREKCCDEMAVAHLHTPPEHYTGAIVDVLAAERRSPHRIPSLAIVGSVRDIEERIRTMLKPGKTFRTRPSVVAATVVLLIALVTIPTALVLTARGQAPSPSQTADKPAAASEKPEQPRFAARTFNSKLRLDVFVCETSESPKKLIGQTPSATPLEIPACWIWWVCPRRPSHQWESLLREMSENKVPGLELYPCTDSDVARLTDLTELQRLQLDAMEGYEITDAGLEHLRGLTGLRTLISNSTQIRDVGLGHLRNLTQLESLELYRTQITDAGLAHIEGLTGLQKLVLQAPDVTDAGLEHLKSLCGLRRLILTGTKITGVGLQHLKGLTNLQDLELLQSQVSDAGLAHIAGLTGLQTVGLMQTRITDAGVEHLTGLPALRSVDVRLTQVTETGVRRLRQTHPNLIMVGQPQPTSQPPSQPAASRNQAAATAENPELPRFAARTFNSSLALYVMVREASQSPQSVIGRTPSAAPLKIPACLIWWVCPSAPVENWDMLVQEINQKRVPGLELFPSTDSDVKHLVGLTALQWLNLGGTELTDAGLEPLRALTGLRYLESNSPQVTDAGLAHLKDLTGLEELHLYRTQITDAGLAHLGGLTRLQRLVLVESRIAGAGLKHLKDLAALQWLNLSTNELTDAGLEHLKDLPALRWLSLCWTPVTDAGLAHLGSLTRLQTLGLIDTPITDAGLAHLAGMVGLRDLQLNSTAITDAGLAHLKRLTGLQTLGLHATKITDAGAGHLERLTELKILGLSRTQITDAGLVHLKGMSALEHLDLTETGITDAGLEHLPLGLRWFRVAGDCITDVGLAHLKRATKLQHLDLWGAQVTDAGLAELKDLSGLRVLCLDGTKVTDVGLVHLKGLTGLQNLQLNNTNIGDAGLAHLKGLTELRWLQLSMTKISDAGLEHLKGLSGLQRLWLQSTGVTDAGMQQLQQSLPNLLIDDDYGTR